MSTVDFGFAIGACLVILISTNNPRGMLWIAAGAASYVVSALAWRLNVPYAAFITGLCDSAVCLAVYFGGKQRWELWIWRLYQVSVAASLIYLASALRMFSGIPHEAYSIVLEVLNWAVLLVIGGTAILQWIGADDDVGITRSWDGVRRLSHLARRQRKSGHFLSKKAE